MPLKTNYVAGDEFGPNDINSTNIQVNLNESNFLNAIGDKKIWVGTQAEYDAITTKDTNTLYFIKEDA